MKQLGLFAAFLVCLFSFRAGAQGLYSGDAILLRTLDYEKIEQHPRLLLKEGQEKEVLRVIENDPLLMKVHEGILSECDKFLSAPPVERIKEGKRLLHVSREALKRIYWLSYAYRMTGNENYAERARVEMLKVSGFSDWNPRHFLDIGEMVMSVAIGYDWLYDYLSESDRKIISDAIMQKGFIPSKDEKRAWFYNAVNNWNQVCNSGLLYGALATFENHPEVSKDVIELALATNPQALECYGPDGGYPEGFNYWCYGTSFQIMMIAALESALGTDAGLCDTPGLLASSYFIQFMTAPSGKCFNFSDTYEHTPANIMMFWCAATLKDNSLVYLEREYLEKLPHDYMDNPERYFAEHRLLPGLLIFASSMQPGECKAPDRSFWSCRGKTPLYIYREGWKDSTDAYLGVKGGSPMTSHAHMDAGSFVYERDGVRWAIDLSHQDYYSLESKGVDLWNQEQNGQRWEVFRLGNQAHSTITVNGQRHIVDSKAEIIQKWEEKSKKGALVDLTSVYNPYLEKAEREVWLDRRNDLRITDRLENKAEATSIQWVMVTSADAEIVSDDTIVLRKDGKKMEMRVSSDCDFSLRIWSNDPPHDYDAPNPGTLRVGFVSNLEPSAKVDYHVTLKSR